MSSNHSVAPPPRESLTALLILILTFASLACSVQIPRFISDEQDPPAAQEHLLSYQVPVSVISLQPGETVPHTQVSFQQQDGGIYYVLIDNQLAEKRVGDSLKWQGAIAPGIEVNYNLRIAPTLLQEDLLLGGSVEVGVHNPSPVEMVSDIPGGDGNLHFGNIFIDFRVPLGYSIPGTTIGFVGTADEEAELSGISGYPYRAAGDSISWQGEVKENASVKYSLRVVSVQEDELRVMGTADLWINPNF